MNKIYSTLLALFVIAGNSLGQCDIDYDFGDAGFGVSPDNALGETFINGEVGVDYYDVLHILVPEFASDVDEIYPPTLPIDSLYLDYITVQDTTTNEEIPLADLGLEVICNNNGDSGLECSFLGGEQYCASLQGVPTMAGVYQINLYVVGWLTIGVPFSVPITFSQFILNIHCNLIETPIVVDANGNEGTLGSIDITPLDGVNVLSYQWVDSDGNIVGTDEDIDGLEPGVYSVFVETEDCTSEYENIVIVDSSVDCNLAATYEITDEIPGVSMGSVDLTITGANGEASYVWTDSSGLTVSTNEDLENASAGDYEVIITDEDGCNLVLDNISVGVNSLEDLELNGFLLTPNPANDLVSVQLDTDVITNIEVRDLRGKIVYSDQLIKNTILEVNTWNQGLYFITISNDLGRLTSRLVIKR